MATSELDYNSSEYDFLDRAESPRQRTEEWFQKRLGKVTGSRAADLMDYRKDGKETAARASYRVEKIAEILTGQIQEHYKSPEMEWGQQQEDAARTRYELEESTLVEQIDFVPWPNLEDVAGGSPDGLVGAEGILEIKCPKTTTHVAWILANKVPDEHRDQMLFYLACTGRKWADFCSFDPRLPKPFDFFTIRMERDDERIAKIQAEVIKFAAEVEATIAQMKKMAA